MKLPPFATKLNPSVWGSDDEMYPIVRLKLLKTAIAFYKFLDVPNLIVNDIIIAGSNAAYNYTPYSDLDIHLIVDFFKLPSPKLTENLFTTKKLLWSKSHDISIKGNIVELYVENSNAPVKSNGLYSVLHGEWLRKPRQDAPDRDDKAIIRKTMSYTARIDAVLADPSIEDIDHILQRLRNLRTNGLMTGGEYSTENLAYKAIRNAGLLDRLWDERTKLLDKSLSLEGRKI